MLSFLQINLNGGRQLNAVLCLCDFIKYDRKILIAMKPELFFKSACLIGLGWLLPFSSIILANAQTTAPSNNHLVIGLSAPMSGSFSVLGQQVEQGVNAAIKASGANVELVVADDHCSAEGGEQAAEQLSKAGVQIVIGYVCSEALNSAMPILKQNQISAISLGSQDLSLTEVQSAMQSGVFRLQPGRKAAITAISDQLAELWRDTPFAVVDDGTIHGRDFAHSALTALRAKGLEPVFTDVYKPAQNSQKPLVARLKRSGATAVLLGGEAEDAVLIGKNAAAAGYKLTIAGDNAFKKFDPNAPLPIGTLMIALSEANTLASAQSARHNIESESLIAEGYTIPAYAAYEIASTALNRAEADKNKANSLLLSSVFSTALGPVSFDADGLRVEATYQLQQINSDGFFSPAIKD